jgi:hypothetical protein
MRILSPLLMGASTVACNFGQLIYIAKMWQFDAFAMDKQWRFSCSTLCEL